MSGPAPTSRFRLIPILLAQAVGFACGLGGIWVNSHLLPPATLGLYGLFLSVVPIGTWVVHAGLVKFVGRHWAASLRRPALAREMVGSWARRLPWLALLAAAAVWLMTGGITTESLLLALALFVAAALLSLGLIAQAALQAMQAHWRDSVVALAGSLTRSFGPPLLYAAIGGGALVLWSGFGLHALVVAATAWWMLRPEWCQPIPAQPGPRTLSRAYEGPLFIILATAGWVLGGLNRWLIAYHFGDIEAGYFTLMGGAAGIGTTMLGSVVMQYAQPGLFALGDRSAGDLKPLVQRADRLALAYIGMAGLLLAGGKMVAPWFVGSLINPAYAPALQWIVPGGGFGITTIMLVIYHATLLAGHREEACGRVELVTAAVLGGGCALSAAMGTHALMVWLSLSPVVPLLLTRPLARHFLLQPAAGPAPAPDPS